MFDKLARKTYLDLLCSSERYAWQDPACDYARGYDMLWLLIPIVGFLLFIVSIEARYERETGGDSCA